MEELKEGEVVTRTLDRGHKETVREMSDNIVHTYVRTLRCRTHKLEPSDPCPVLYVLIS
jgi:hypothetical protein